MDIQEKAKETQDLLLPTLDYLERRWQDEKKYEDFNNYQKALANKVPKDVHLKSFTKKPFKCVLTFENYPDSELALWINGTKGGATLSYTTPVEDEETF